MRSLANAISTPALSNQLSRTIIVGEVCNAPAAFGDQLTVVTADAPEAPIGPMDWGASQGNTLPQAGDACVVVFDDQLMPYCVWFDGTYSTLSDADKSPRGNVETPEAHGAKGDAVIFTDGAIAAGSTTVTSAAFTSSSLPGGANSKNLYIAWAGAGTAAGSPSSALSTGSPIASIPRTSGAVVPAGPILIQSGAHAQLFWTSGAAANASIPVSSQTPTYAFPTSSTLTFGNAGLNGKVESVANGSAVISNAANSSVQGMVGWYGTDDTAAFNAALAALADAGGGELLLDAKQYLVDGAPGGSDSYAVVQIPAPSFGVPITITGVRGDTAPTQGYTAAGNSKLLTTHLAYAYSSTYGVPSVLGSWTFKQQSYTLGPMVTIRNLDVYVPETQGMAGIDLSRCIGCHLENVNVQGAGMLTGGPYGAIGQVPNVASKVGIILPMVSNGGAVTGDNVQVAGMYAGVIGSEHNAINRMYVGNCVVGLGFPSGGGGHANTYSYLDIEGCRYAIGGWDPSSGIEAIPSSTDVFPLRAHLDIEDQLWQWTPVSHVYDGNNMLAGGIQYFHWASGDSTALTVTGASGLKLDSDIQVKTLARAYRTASLSLTTGWQSLVFDTETFDLGDNFSTSTGKYTCPAAGYYRVTVTVRATCPTSGTEVYAGLAYNGTLTLEGAGLYTSAASQVPAVTLTDVIYCNAGDTLEPEIYMSNAGSLYVGATYVNAFVVERIAH